MGAAQQGFAIRRHCTIEEVAMALTFGRHCACRAVFVNKRWSSPLLLRIGNSCTRKSTEWHLHDDLQHIMAVRLDKYHVDHICKSVLEASSFRQCMKHL